MREADTISTLGPFLKIPSCLHFYLGTRLSPLGVCQNISPSFPLKAIQVCLWLMGHRDNRYLFLAHAFKGMSGMPLFMCGSLRLQRQQSIMTQGPGCMSVLEEQSYLPHCPLDSLRDASLRSELQHDPFVLVAPVAQQTHTLA